MVEGSKNGEGLLSINADATAGRQKVAGSIHPGRPAMNFETVSTKSQPILYVRRSASMAPKEISEVMGEAFGAIGAFVGKNRIAPAGPPLAIYRDWDEKTGRMTVDVAFPVSGADAAKAADGVMAGETPSGKALKAIHRGPYDTLRETYDSLQEHMKKSGIPMPPIAWEVYLNDPESTAPKDLLTEIYMPVP
jgi:effector-binding domain-containing protein